MINFETQFFQKVGFTPEQLKQYFISAERDYGIAHQDEIPEVRFKFSYDALIKIGIVLIARHGYKVRSQPGHHVKIIEKLGEILADEDLDIFGNTMRQRRNKDFYDGGAIITETEAQQYVDFVALVIEKARNNLQF
jgi:hypothetical protein